MKNIKCILADDQKVFIESLKTYIESLDSSIEIISLVHNGKDVVEAVAELDPDIILMDVRMPQMSGVEATKIIRREYPKVKVIILSTFDDREYIDKAMEYGAAGYLLKEDIEAEELLFSIKAVAKGAVLFSPKVADKLIHREQSQVEGQNEEGEEQSKDLPFWLYSLSKKEKRILRYIMEGYENIHIAEEMYLAEQTVKNYISIIYSKMNVNSRTQAIKKAYSYRRYFS